MTDLEIVVRRIIREELRAALEEMLPRLQRQRAPLTIESEDELLFSTREAAKRLAISERTLFRLTQSGQLPCVRVGMGKRYSVTTLKNWIQQCEAVPACKPDTQARKSIDKLPTAKPMRARTAKPGSTARTMNKQLQSTPPANKPATRKAIARHAAEAEDQKQSPNPFSLLLEEIGVDRADLPPITNGDLMQIAEVDIPTLHGWLYLHRPMAEEAVEKLRRYFRKYRRQGR